MARVAVVTGGTRGIGHAISVALKKKGYRVAATYAGNDAAAQKFQAETGIPVYKFDVGDYAACEKGIAEITKALGPIDVLVNNAGITRDGMLHRMTQENGTPSLRPTSTPLQHEPPRHRRHARPLLRPHHQHLVDQRAQGPDGPDELLRRQGRRHGFTKALAQEGAAKGITSTSIAPGYINTEMVAAVPKEVLTPRSCRTSRSAASARPRRSPAAWRSSPPTTPASSPAPASTPTAASTWPPDLASSVMAAREAAIQVTNQTSELASLKGWAMHRPFSYSRAQGAQMPIAKPADTEPRFAQGDVRGPLLSRRVGRQG